MSTLLRTLPPVSEMERASRDRDAAYDGLFYVAVRTTGIFCRPTCPARKPLAKNVEYFASSEESLRAGYRPCKRCRPLAADDAPPWAESLLTDIERDPAARMGEAALRRRGLDPATVRRYFRRRFGMTFQAFVRARRLSGAFGRIRAGGSVDDAVFESGYASHSGFREAFSQLFGIAPGRGRLERCVRLAWVRTPLGPMVAGASDDGVCLLEFSDRRMLETQCATLRRLMPGPFLPGEHPHLTLLGQELEAYFHGRLRRFTVPLALPGTAFQERVWKELQEIPYGATRSYEELARRIEQPAAVRAVGRANGMNRIAIVVPCHRVVNKNGQRGGYGGGVRRKEFLLDLERRGSR